MLDPSHSVLESDVLGDELMSVVPAADLGPAGPSAMDLGGPGADHLDPAISTTAELVSDGAVAVAVEPAAAPAVDEPHPSQLAYLGLQLLRLAGTRGREAAEELLA